MTNSIYPNLNIILVETQCMKWVCAIFIFLFSKSVNAEDPTFFSIIDSYFESKGVVWESVQNLFDKQLKEWGYKLQTNKKHLDYLKFFGDYPANVKPIERTIETDSVVNQLDRLGGFHAPQGEPIMLNGVLRYPVPWWHSLIHVERGYDYEEFTYDFKYSGADNIFHPMFKGSVEGGFGPARICQLFHKEITPDIMELESIQKLTIALIFPFLLPSEKKDQLKMAEAELDSTINNAFGDELHWNEIQAELYSYIDQNYQVDTVFKALPSYRFKSWLEQIAISNEVEKYENENLKSLLTKKKFLVDDKIQFVILKELIQPSYFKYKMSLEKFHPICGYYESLETLSEPETNISLSILATALNFTCNEIDMEKPVYQKLMILMIADHLLK